MTMKVTLNEKNIHAYHKAIEIEVEGKIYLADLNYSSWDGYELNFIDGDGNYIDMPKWADDYDNGSRSLEYDLDVMTDGEGE